MTILQIPLSPLETIFKEVQSPQIVGLRAFLILRLSQIAPFRSKNQRAIHESKNDKKNDSLD